MTIPQLGTLEKLDPRKAWPNEASHFTPWLAEEENLKLLGDAIGHELELEAQEKYVGPFRADILCRGSGPGDHWVLIENQLEVTDHSHLGQIITYTAGLHAATIVWVAHRFREEHRAALDWLNEKTEESISFFGLEVELWRIGNSPPAPKFNVVSHPNDWTRSVTAATRGVTSPGLTPTREMQLRFWTQLTDLQRSEPGLVKPTKPQSVGYMVFSVGKSEFCLLAGMNTQKKHIYVVFLCRPPNGWYHHDLLLEQKHEIDQELGESLEWPKEIGKSKEVWVALTLKSDPTDESKWTDQIKWVRDKLEDLRRVFEPRIRKLPRPSESQVIMIPENADE